MDGRLTARMQGEVLCVGIKDRPANGPCFWDHREFGLTREEAGRLSELLATYASGGAPDGLEI